MNASAEPPVTILIADDHPLMRQGIRMALAREERLEVSGEAANGEEALQCIAFLNPDVVILDLDMPKRDGLSVVRELNRLHSAVGVIILTLHTGADLLYEALDLGVRGYILKSSAVSEIAEAVRRVTGGGSYLSEAVLQAMRKGRPAAELTSDLQQLTPLELRLVRKIAEGFTSREIAASLDLSGRTVENYRTAICTKLNLRGPNALLRYALSQRSALTDKP
ncbi:response regulator transcription factor [Acidipila sp. EB88]|uniref:response regulator transcription factor n=1 Tax=Acidipila sp. EB88 TaxID=2305226 RepID=UPI000F5F8DBB|nr:response regulator transcription factor [Acidipila sp. EB88]RRA48465.1 DNA-binding response regulator [Acidipila sp. EB88]